uniref:(northern house mosquito) hypothetical protein n=1 Tax=Culex pipiens TaxID=7175 RepID=A0A8D8C9R2_CULPI
MNTNVFLFLEKRGRNRFPPPEKQKQSQQKVKKTQPIAYPRLANKKNVNKQTYVIIQASIKIFVRKTMITAINVKNMSEEQIVTKNIKQKNQTKKNAQTTIKPGVLEENLCK